jgi:SAM-dependent methyltransferase
MNWISLRRAPWLDTRAQFIAGVPHQGALLDMGSSDGETLGHFHELRPDLRYFSTDLEGRPEKYPPGCQFHRGDIQRDKLPWPDASMDAITCMQLVEHLQDLKPLFQEAARLLKPGGSLYVETPHPKTLVYSSSWECPFTINFYDEPTHTRPVPLGLLAQFATAAGLSPVKGGVSRNWLFAALWPFYFFRPPSRQKFTSLVHWRGWSVYLICRRPPTVR